MTIKAPFTPERQRQSQRLYQVLHCANSDANNCKCRECVWALSLHWHLYHLNTMLMLMLTLMFTQTQTLRVKKSLSRRFYCDGSLTQGILCVNVCQCQRLCVHGKFTGHSPQLKTFGDDLPPMPAHVTSISIRT